MKRTIIFWDFSNFQIAVDELIKEEMGKAKVFEMEFKEDVKQLIIKDFLVCKEGIIQLKVLGRQYACKMTNWKL